MIKVPVILAGYADDLDFVTSHLRKHAAWVRMDEHTPESFEIPEADLVVYVFSPDTGYSSQLLARFICIHLRAAPREERILRVKGAIRRHVLFDFAKGLPEMSLADLQRKWNHDGSEMN